MEPRPPVGAEAVAKMTPSAGSCLLGADARPMLLLPGVTLGLAFLCPRLDLRLLALLDMLGKLFISFTSVLGARRPRPRRVHDQSFSQPRFAI